MQANKQTNQPTNQNVLINTPAHIQLTRTSVTPLAETREWLTYTVSLCEYNTRSRGSCTSDMLVLQQIVASLLLSNYM